MRLRSAPSSDWIVVGCAIAISMGALLGSFSAHLSGSSPWVGTALGGLRGALYFGVLCAALLAVERVARQRAPRAARLVMAVLLTTLLITPVEWVHDLITREEVFPSLAPDALVQALANKAAHLLWPISFFAIASLAPRWMRSRRNGSEPFAVSSILEGEGECADEPVDPLRSAAHFELGVSIAPETLADVLAVGAEAHYVALTMASGRRLLVHGRFCDALLALSAWPGLQVHRSHWVADRAVASLTESRSGARLQLVNGANVPISRRFAASALRRYRQPVGTTDSEVA